MKLAHLILAHNEPGQLERLIKRLAHPDAHIYIHLDLKTGIEPFEYLAKMSNVFFIKDRVTVHWGSFSIVEATLSGFRQIAASDIAYCYVNLLSGQDYPLKSAAFIQKYLSDHPDTAFMNYLLFDPEFRSFIKLTWGPDEFIFQTILYNSIHQSKMRDQDLRYIDWSNGGVSPKLLTMADADAIMASRELFARKFDGRKDAAILTYIDEQADA